MKTVKVTKALVGMLLSCAPVMLAQSVSPLLQPRQSFADRNGIACVQCKLYSYQAGTTTPLATYTDSTGTTQNANPVTLDSSGSANIWLTNSPYKFVLTNPAGATIWTVDNVPGSTAGTYLPFAGGTLTGTLNTKNLDGRLTAPQWCSPSNCSSNNGIAMSLAECNSLPYACSILAPGLYSLTESQPLGGSTAWFLGQTTGPTSANPLLQFEDERYGVPQWIFNGSASYDNRHNAWPSMVMNYAGNPPLAGTFQNVAGALNLQTNIWSGTRNFWNDKTETGTLNILTNKYAEAQNGGTIGAQLNCIGFGDCNLEGFTIFFRGGHTAGDEGPEPYDAQNAQDTVIPTATVQTASADSTGLTSLTTTGLTNGSWLGDGLNIINTTASKEFGGGCYISLIQQEVSNLGLVLTANSACNIDSTFGLSGQTTLTAAIQNPGSTNIFPATNYVASVADLSIFTVGQNACIWDYDEDCELVTAKSGSSGAGTITLGRVDHPHPNGSWVTAGGLGDGYCVSLAYDDVTSTSLINSGSAAMPLQTIPLHQCFPIMENLSGDRLVLFLGYNVFPPGSSGSYQGSAYRAMSGSGATCTTTIAGGAVTAINITAGGTGYQSATNSFGLPLNPPQIVLTGSWTTAPSGYVSAINSSGVVTAATVANGGTGVTSASCSVVTSNPFTIYQMARAVNVYDASAGQIDGNIQTEPWPVTPAASDTLQQPDDFRQHSTMGNTKISQLFPYPSGSSRSLYNGILAGNVQGSDLVISAATNVNPMLYNGYPLSTPGIAQQGQWLTPDYLGVFTGAYRRYSYYYMPPFAPGQTATDPGGFDPGLQWQDCGISNDCTKWTHADWLVGGNTVPINGLTGAGFWLNPSTGTIGGRGNLDLTHFNSVSLPPVSLGTTGQLVSGLGANYVIFSNDLTNAAWFQDGGTVTTSTVSDPTYGNVTQLVMSASALFVQQNPGGTALTPGQPYAIQATMRSTSGTDNIAIYFDTTSGIPSQLVGTSWATYCFTGVVSNPGTNGFKAAFSNNDSGTDTIDVANVTVNPGTSCGIPVTTTSAQVTNPTLINTIQSKKICLQDGTNCPSAGATVQRVSLTSGICTTTTTAYNTCTQTITWPSAFADTGYSATCTGAPPTSGLFYTLYVSGKTTTGATVTLQNGDASGAAATTTNEIDCIGVHP